MMPSYYGDIAEDATLNMYFFTTDAEGAPIAPSAPFVAGDFEFYKDGSIATITGTVTYATPQTGLHILTIDTSGDGDFSVGSEWLVTIADGTPETVDGQAVDNTPIGSFSIENRIFGQPAGATLSADIAAVKAETATIEGQTDDIGVAGAGLSDLGGMSDGMKSEVNVKVDGALDTAISELAQGVPTATPTVRTALMLLYMALRNKTDVATSGTDTLEIHSDDGTRIAQKLLTDDGSDYSEAKMTSGA